MHVVTKYVQVTGPHFSNWRLLFEFYSFSRCGDNTEGRSGSLTCEAQSRIRMCDRSRHLAETSFPSCIGRWLESKQMCFEGVWAGVRLAEKWQLSYSQVMGFVRSATLQATIQCFCGQRKQIQGTDQLGRTVNAITMEDGAGLSVPYM